MTDGRDHEHPPATSPTFLGGPAAWRAASRAAHSQAGTGSLTLPRHRPRWPLVVIAIVVQLPGFAFAAGHPFLHAVYVLAALSSFLLLGSARFPGPVVTAVAVLCAPAIAFGFGPPVSAVPLAIAVFVAILHGARPWAWGTLVGLAIAGPSAVALVHLARSLTGSPASVVRPLAVVLALSLLVGFAEMQRGRREHYREMAGRVAAQRQAEAEAERTRIARELHDVLAHSLSQISVQAGVGLHLFETQPDRAKESLDAIKKTSSDALDEVRGVLGFLREDGVQGLRTPGPGLDRLPGLISSFRDLGLNVDVRGDLGTNVWHSAQLAIYRIVQESLTNIARHAPGADAEILLERRGAAYEVTVTDDGPGPGDGYRPGRGMVGMRERAQLLRGSFEAGPGAEGGFRVHAVIPMRAGDTT